MLSTLCDDAALHTGKVMITLTLTLSTPCDDAALHTGKVMSLRPEVQDVAAQVLYERALLLAESPPGIDWNGVDVLTEKHFEAGGAGGAGATE